MTIAVLIAWSVPVVAQTPPATAQCNSEQLTQCGQYVRQCGTDVRAVHERNKQLGQQLDTLRARTCAQESEPRWREIIEAVVKARVEPLRRTRSASNCEEFKYVVENNGKVSFEGRLRDRSAVQQAKDDLRQRLPGLEIDDQKVRLLDGPCGLAAVPGYQIETGPNGGVSLERDNLTDRRRNRLPPDSECMRIGQAMEADPNVAPEIKQRVRNGFWVMRDGLAAVCRKAQASTTDAWEVSVTNPEPGLVILREAE